MEEDFFSTMTKYCNQSNTMKDNHKRAELLGIKSSNVQVAPGANVRIPVEQIGNNVFFGLYGYFNGDVTVEDDVLIGPHCSIVASNHKFDPTTGCFSLRSKEAPVVIGRGSWLASNVTVTPGVKIGKANLVCAGSVVTKSTQDYAIVAGVPAKQVGTIDPVTGEYLWNKNK